MSHPSVSNPGRTVGLRNVGSYQVSGHPYVTGTANMKGAGNTFHVKFPYVTKSVTVIASGTSQINVQFSHTASGNVNGGQHYVTLSGSGPNFARPEVTFDVKCKEIFITNLTANAGFQVYASLTGIPHERMYDLTGIPVPALIIMSSYSSRMNALSPHRTLGKCS